MSTQTLKKIYSGKVRDLYELDAKRMLMVASDRLSAFDVVLPEPIADKGKILTQMALFWFRKLQHIMPNHLTGEEVTDVLPETQASIFAGRSMVVKKLVPLKIEAIVRGYLAGSGWQDYQRSGQICGITLPKGMQLAQKLPQAIFTPSSKAAVGDHDENITLTQCAELIGTDMLQEVEAKAIRLYQEAADYAYQKGIIIADTKFEFGLDEDGTLTLMDEVLTPDSSRFWASDQYQIGHNPPSFDKQFIRDWLSSSGWNKQPPAPVVPADVLRQTQNKYREALALLTDQNQG
ncbi:phosphoribosylaminoimidazolesuccinocarboxamide synthase [Neisseriaceae bacterium ESL0693]|nr:phosphoribosylaminoimidazolesuccinocarboxamide synthase [Neisseriaceae bacterium ESL0693]